MNGRTPHIVQYQGSKRLLAPQILSYMPNRFNRLLEPFAGMAAITIATAERGKSNKFHINDINEPIVNLLKEATQNPTKLISEYTTTWNAQFEFSDGHIQHFYHIRDIFNEGEQTASNTLYLLARCVKGSVRYGRNGKFNQSPDKRRHGTNPKNIADNVRAVSSLLNGRTDFSSLDYHDILDMAQPGDLVYMDPPYQGVSNVRDNRYLCGVDFYEFSESLSLLNRKGVDYLISYDGECGGRAYGDELPSSLRCRKLLLNAGTSTQATLLGKKETTFESLYVSENLCENIRNMPKQMDLWEDVI